MDWLKDKKNQPIVAAIASVVIVAVIVVMWLTVFKKPSDEMAPVGTETTDMAPPVDPSAAPVPSVPAATTTPAAAPAAGNQASITPMESWRTDPFLPLNYKPPTRQVVKARPRIIDLPLGALFPPRERKIAAIAMPEPPQPPRRMAGLLLNGRIFAIIESNGKSEIVQPGDTLSDRLAVVEKIERDRVILKTTSEHPRYIVVRMAAAPSSGAAPASTTPDMGPGARGRRPGAVPGGPSMDPIQGT